MRAIPDQRSSRIGISRALRVSSPLAGRSVSLGVWEGCNNDDLHARQKTTAQPPSFEVAPRVRRICSRSELLARSLTIVVVTLLTIRQCQSYAFWGARREPFPKAGVCVGPRRLAPVPWAVLKGRFWAWAPAAASILGIGVA